MTELHPCPFCGSDPQRSDCIGCGYIQVICPNCGANISIVISKDLSLLKASEDELIRRWNSRTGQHQ